MRLDKYFTLSLILVVVALCNTSAQTVNRISGNNQVGSTNEFVFYTDNNPNFRFVRWDVYGNYTIEYSSGNVIRLHWNSTTAPSSVIAVYDNLSTWQYGLTVTYNVALTYPPPPAAPSALVATTASSSQINLQWTDNSTTEASFRIERSLTSGSGFTQIATTAANATSYSNTGLAGSTKYYYRIRAVDAYSSRSAYSAEASATTRMTPPSAPSNLAATTVSSTQINLTWTDNATNESGFQIERSLTSGSGFTVLTTTGANVTSYSNSGLTAATKYYYRVRAINSGGNSAYAPEANATTLPNPPSAPTNLVATTASSTQINLTWTDNSSNESGFQIERSLTSGSGFTLVTTTSANITSYSNSGLAASTPYFYRVRAINTGGNSAYTLEANATTLPNPPSAPSNLVATTVSSTQINLTWTDNSSNETGFEIERSLTTESGFTLLTTTAPNVTSYANIGCTANTQYFYRVRAINSGGNSDYTPQASATTSPNLPSAPTNLVATTVSSTQIDLTWVDNASNETGFEIERSLTPGSGFTLLTTTAANVTSFANIGCTANTQYFYRVRAINSGGNSDYTSQANATTLPNPPSAPTNLVATTVSSAQINLTWTDNVTNETGFMIERSLTSGSGFTRVFTTAANATSYSDTGLTGGTRYFYRLQATNTGGNSGYTSEASATTLQNPPAAPDQIAGLPVSSTTVIVTWLDKSNNETGFQIERAGGKDYAGYSLIATTSANVTTFTDTGLTPGSYYYYRARAINSAGNSPYTIDVSALTFPPQPSQFTAQATSGSSITLNWTAPENSHTTEFQVERSTAPGSGFVLISSPGGDARSFVDGGLSEGTTYFYRISAKNNSGSSVYTPVMNAKTFYTPVAPTELIAQATSATSVTLNWADNSDNETGFHIERSVVAGSGFELISIAPANATSFVDGSLMDGTTYFYRVRSTNGTGNSAYTVVASAKTELVSTVLIDVLEDWAFQYRYDSRNRMIAKKVPGADWIYYVYDDRDRLVMTQDGEQRKVRKWTFTKYDALNRPILTGLYTHSGFIDQASMSGLISKTNFFEDYNGAPETHGYSNVIFPKDNLDVLTVNYYDNYHFKALINDAALNYNNNTIVCNQGDPYCLPEQESLQVIGQQTGTKTKVLGETTYLWSAAYYDEKYRAIQTIGHTYRGTYERITNVFDFVGKVWKTKTTLEAPDNTLTSVYRRFEYDHAGRLIQTWHTVDDAQTEVLLSENEYNELGQLVDKKLHSVDNGATFMQSVDYRYNIRGWLTSINNSTLTSDDGITNEETDDLFGMNLVYNEEVSGLNNAPQFNGNISAIQWNKGGALGGVKEQAYNFAYDPMNRLTAATHKEKNTVWNSSGAYHEDGFQYDLNGNIERLSRTGKQGVSMDQLVYHYKGNQLLKVDDTADKATGFADGGNLDDDYTYDGSGNMTVDKNKGITSIAYNHLNLPEKVTKKNGDYIKYIYDATGRKLSQQVYNSSHSLKKKSDYLGEHFYQNDTLKFINHEEGRVVINGSSPEYQYHMKDHLGNVRLTFTTKEETESATATLETSNAAEEHSRFLNYAEVRKIDNKLFDHTNEGGTYNSTRLMGGGSTEEYGLAKSLSVMPGDIIRAEVYVKYLDSQTDNWSAALRNVIAAIAGAENPTGTYVDGGAVGSTNGPFPFPDLLAREEDNGIGPKAYLNYLIFDRDFNYLGGGFKRVPASARESGVDLGSDGEGISHERLYFEDDIIIKEAGYVYIYLSNENETPVEVFFDDFKVEHVKSPVVQMDDYYPFGLTFNSYSRENSFEQKYQYNGKKLQDELNLGWLDYGARMYDPAISRWMAVDPLADLSRKWSPYTYGNDNPIRFIDPTGMYSTEEWKKDNGITDDDLITVYRAPSDDNEGNNESEDQEEAKPVTLAPSSVLGTTDYYKFRRDDFQKRYGKNKKAPTYYMSYGDKYAQRFSSELYPKLSGQGKDWLIKTRYWLQILMENGLADNPAMELDDKKFTNFAFDTHPEAYIRGGLLELGFEDKLEIALTPDVQDLMSPGGIKQMGIIMERQAEYYQANPGVLLQHIQESPHAFIMYYKILERYMPDNVVK